MALSLNSATPLLLPYLGPFSLKHLLQLNFPRTMGYQQEVVERVVKETGQTEDTFLVLEKIVEETKRCEEGSKGGEKDRRLSSARSPDEPSSSSSSSSTSQLRERERELSRALGDPGRSKENIKPNQHGGSSNGLGHRRQCSGSETRTQQVHPFSKRLFFFFYFSLNSQI